MPQNHTGHWNEPPCLLTPGEDEVHVWCAFLDRPPDQASHFEALLSEDEIARARKYRFPLHRDRFVSRRAFIRLLLGRYLGIPAPALQFDYTGYGKPRLAIRHATKLRFNVSSSHDLALAAIAYGRDVGVDVEKINEDLFEESIPEQFFSARETATLRALSRSCQTAAFFDCWARKEAYIKAKGMGLSLPLDSFDVSFGDAKPARLLRTLPDPQETERWTMMALHPAPGHAAALVIEGQVSVVRCWNFQPRFLC